ncbi:MAG: hypothetical protein JXA89_02570 [Anaerolineae bacterium]|nr:hypothetical protein [Anaerolineae bacterium]
MKRRTTLLVVGLVALTVLACNLGSMQNATEQAPSTKASQQRATGTPTALARQTNPPMQTATTRQLATETATARPESQPGAESTKSLAVATPVPTCPLFSTPQAPPAPTSLNLRLQVVNPANTDSGVEPVTSGVPLPHDLNITDPAQLQLVNTDGAPIMAQFTPLARWGGAPDDESKPIRWLLIDFQAAVCAGATGHYFLQEGGPGPTPPSPLTVTDDADSVVIDTGAAQFRISKRDGRLVTPGLSEPLYARAHAAGVEYTTGGDVTIHVALQGPLRASVHVKGAYRDTDGSSLLDYTTRFWFYAGQSAVRLFHTVENNTPCPLREYDQIDCYRIGSEGSVVFDDLSLIVPSDLGSDLTYQVGSDGETLRGDLEAQLNLVQDSNGTDSWDRYRTIVDWEDNPLDARPRMQAFVSLRGYRTTLGQDTVDSGDHAPGWLSVSGDGGTWRVGMREFWQNFPKALRAAPDGTIELGLFPAEFGTDEYAFTLRAGEHKTHEIMLSFSASTGEADPDPLGNTSLFAQAPSQWYIDSGVFGPTAVIDHKAWPDHEDYVDAQLDTAPTYETWMDWQPNLLASIAFYDMYGIYDYGDWPIDYEGYGGTPLNVKYDNDYGAWLQWVRGGDPRWFSIAEALDRHTADIDVLHTLHSPRHWSDGIAFGHSLHDEDGFTNPHRNEGGNHPDTAFGMLGLLTTYYLTGYEKAYETAIELADSIEYRLHHDNNLCARFPDCSGEGYALAEGMYDAGCRPAANTLRIAVAAYRATADPRYLAVADALVDWARAEKQPYINGPTGEDWAMRPWMLNLYLRALSEYIDMRSEFDLADPYEATKSFLSYADWLRTYAWIELEAGDRAAYPYEWFFDGRQGDPNDEYALGNNIPSLNNWLLLGADAMAYAYRLSEDDDYMQRAMVLFHTGSRDPWFEGDTNTYAQCKETANSVSFGHVFLYEWRRR